MKSLIFYSVIVTAALIAAVSKSTSTYRTYDPAKGKSFLARMFTFKSEEIEK